ncbi:hypothetical protein ACJX0J_028752, partial [Zea mays]
MRNFGGQVTEEDINGLNQQLPISTIVGLIEGKTLYADSPSWILEHNTFSQRFAASLFVLISGHLKFYIHVCY